MATSGGHSCDTCDELLRNKEDIDLPEKRFLAIDVDASVINKPTLNLKENPKIWKKERDSFISNLKKKLSALRNSKGGCVLVHINNLENGDRDLDHFHELVDVRLDAMIEDGSLFVDTYKKIWLPAINGKVYSVVAITVTGTPRVVTLDLKTKTPLDNSINDSTNETVHKLVKNTKTFKKKNPSILGIDKDKIKESRSVQVKALTLPADELSSLLQTVSKFIEHVWKTLKLRCYISAFSKVDGGGSFFLGIEEKQKIYSRYISKTLQFKPFRYNTSHHQDFIHFLKAKVQQEITILSGNQCLLSFRDPINLIEVKFHPIQEYGEELYILEVAVAGVEGIVFYDKEGPEAYELKGENCVRIGGSDWYKRFLKSSVQQRRVNKEEAQEVSVSSLDQSLPTIFQIGSSIDDIQNYVMKDREVNIYPGNSSTDSIKTLLYERIREISKSGLAFVSDNLSVCANMETKIQPNEVLFDVCMIMKDVPPVILTVAQPEHVNTKSVVRYNLSLAREAIDGVRSFTDEPFSALYGVITHAHLKDKESFLQALNDIEKKISASLVPGSLELPDTKRQRIILALLSSVALTTSVDDKNDSLWFLTLEQFVKLTENIDKREVTVRTVPSSGGKVLMREIARRLERSGPTLLVMESEEQIQVARKQETCSFVLTLEEWKTAKEKDLEGLTNMVTNCHDSPPPPGITGKSWTFVAVQDTGQGQLQESTFEAAGELTQSVTTMIDTPLKIEGKTQENPPEFIIDELRKELESKNKEINKLKVETEKLKETEDELSRMVDKVSLSEWSVDSGRGLRDTSSVASFGSFSDAKSRLVSDLPGATAGQGEAEEILKNVKKALKISRSKRDFGTNEEESKRMIMSALPTSEDEWKWVQMSALPIREEDWKWMRMLALPIREEDWKWMRMLALKTSEEEWKWVQISALPISEEEWKRVRMFALKTSEEEWKWVRMSALEKSEEDCKRMRKLGSQHEMDGERVRGEYSHVTEDGKLVNTESTSLRKQGIRRFEKYQGTCSTFPIHLPPSLTPVPQYIETETTVGEKRYNWRIVMEIGVVEENMLDSREWVYQSPRAWCVKVGFCEIHPGYCTQVWNEGKYVKCVGDTMADTPGTSYTLRYGVVVDMVRGRVGFVDVDKGVVLRKMDVKFRQTIYPVFGVCPFPDYITVEMRLITGSDVTMTEDKQKLIYSCLT